MFYVDQVSVTLNIRYLKTLVDSFGIPLEKQRPRVAVGGIRIPRWYVDFDLHRFPCWFLVL